MSLRVGSLIMSFGGSTISAIAAHFLIVAMTGEINRKKDEHSQLSYFHVSPVRVLREYKTLYPGGFFSTALIVTVIFACVLWSAFIYLMFFGNSS